MMHEREKSDLAIVAVKPANKAERFAAEPVEPRAGAEGNVGQHSTDRAQNRATVSQALERIRQVARQHGSPRTSVPRTQRGRGSGSGWAAVAGL
jgi:hypothetical protein